jgi:putative intracellular protease/amidase
VSTRPTLLVDLVDAIGADPADTRERVQLLRRAGHTVRAIALGRGAHAADAPVDEVAMWTRDRAALGRLREVAKAGRFERVVIAGGDGDAAELQWTLRGTAPLRHWPTAFAPGGRWRSLVAGPAVTPLFAAHDAGAAERIMSGCAFERSARGRLGLWDGDYVLAPLPLAGAVGEAVLRAFADVAAERSELDLVVLAEATPWITRHAEALGIGTRVHCAGLAPRDAEWAWWSHASAAVLGGNAAFAGGLVLRALAASCPLVVPRDAAACAAAGEWLTSRGATPWGMPDPAALAAVLETLLARDAAVETAVECGRAVAARHDAATLVERLAESTHDAITRRSREAA